MDSTRDKIGVKVKWMLTEHLHDVAEIERESYGADARTAQRIMQLIRHQTARVMVAETADGEIAGHMIYVAQPRQWVLHDVVVHPKYRRCGVGRQLVYHVKARTAMRGAQRKRVECVVTEDQLEQHLFLRACGFRYTHTIHDDDMDRYHFLFCGASYGI